MSDALARVQALVSQGNVRISDHGYDELAEDGIFARDIIVSLPEAVSLEDYPEYPKGACVLTLQSDRSGRPIHAVWGIPKGEDGPAVLVTAYRPDPSRWTDDFRRRK